MFMYGFYKTASSLVHALLSVRFPCPCFKPKVCFESFPLDTGVNITVNFRRYGCDCCFSNASLHFAHREFGLW